MAISTYKTFLMHSTDGVTYEKLIDIKSFPNLGGTPEQIETTTLSNRMQTFINGIQQLDSFEFTANYDLNDYKRLLAMEGEDTYYSVWLGGQDGAGGGEPTPTGEHGKYNFKGALSVFTTGGGVNEVVNLTITIAASTSVALAQD